MSEYRATMRYVATHLCRMNGKGQVEVIKTRKTFKAGCRMEDSVSLTSTGFIVRSYVQDNADFSDYGTVYFFDANGELLPDCPINC